MFSSKIKYSLMALTILGFSGCNQRTITLYPNDRTARVRHLPSISGVSSRPVIREEVLIKKNPSLGSIVSSSSVPKKRPSSNTTSTTNSSHGHYANIDDSIDRADLESRVEHAEVIERMPFPVEEYARLRKRGYSTVIGTIYVENSNSGEKIMGQKVKLWLNPVTSYSDQWYQQDYLGGYKLTKIDKRIFNYMKLEYSKSDGSFRFSGIPKGEYYLVGSIKCTEGCGLKDKNEKVRLVKRVFVDSGVNNIDLTKYVP